MQPVDRFGRAVNEHGQLMGEGQKKRDTGITAASKPEELGFCIGLSSLLNLPDTVEEFFALCGASKVEVPVIERERCILRLQMDVDGVEVHSQQNTLKVAVETSGSLLAEELLDPGFGYVTFFPMDLTSIPGPNSLSGKWGSSQEQKIPFAYVQG